LFIADLLDKHKFDFHRKIVAFKRKHNTKQKAPQNNKIKTIRFWIKFKFIF